MRGPKPRYPIYLLENEIRTLRQWIQARNSPQVKGMRGRIVLTAHEHPEWSNQQIAAEVGALAGRCGRGGAGTKPEVLRLCLGQGHPGVFPLKGARKRPLG